MDCCPTQSDLPCCVKNDTWTGFTDAYGSSPDGVNLALVRVGFVNEYGATAGLTLSSAVSGQITINNAAAWNYTIEPVVLNLPVGKWTYGVETTDANGYIATRVSGTIEISVDPVP